jgi:hypothetical protein
MIYTHNTRDNRNEAFGDDGFTYLPSLDRFRIPGSFAKFSACELKIVQMIDTKVRADGVLPKTFVTLSLIQRSRPDDAGGLSFGGTIHAQLNLESK